jgi:hypothetical protein
MYGATSFHFPFGHAKSYLALNTTPYMLQNVGRFDFFKKIHKFFYVF